MRKLGNTLLSLLLIVPLTGALFPLYFMLVHSLKEPSLATLRFKDLLPLGLTLRNYVDIFSSGPLGIFILNSLLVALAVTAGNLLFCTMVGYAFARRRFPLKEPLFASALLVLMIPAHIIIIPIYILINRFGWYDTYLALIVPWLVNPLGIFLMRQYIENLPEEIEEAARLDGAGDFKILFKIVMPLSKPALAVLGIQIFLTNWNSFLFPFILTASERMRTLPVALALYRGYQTIDWSHLFAGTALSALPVILAFLLFQKQIVSGLTAGALKQ
jgi:multiple sugar transport system permease protein